MITNEAQLNALCFEIRRDALANVADYFITIDTEFMRRNVDMPILSLIQIGTPRVAEVVDILTFDGSLRQLINIMSDEHILKVFHGSDQDIDILARNNIFLKNVYDTQLAELVISTEKVASYETLVQKYMKRQLQKQCKVSDWCQRPLTPQQEEYALNDVIYLRDVFKHQIEIVRRMGRVNIVLDELKNRITACSKTSEAGVLSVFHDNIYSMNDDSKKILNELAIWRSTLAEKKSVPDYLIIKNDVLLSIAKGGICRVAQLKRSKAYKENNYMKDFLNFAGKICTPYSFKPCLVTDNVSHIVDLLKVIADYCSNKFSINKTFLADSDDISGLAQNIESVHKKFSYGWRYDMFGRYVQAALRGNISIFLNNNELEVKENE